MVRLLHVETALNALADGFNPTMVRLLPGSSRSSQGLTGAFQSHNGAIAAGLGASPNEPAPCLFQSHNGAIAAC